MRYRSLGRTGVKISEVSLGTWQLGGSDWGDVSDDDALRILHEATDQGMNFLDTADVYGGGRSEQLIGRFLKETKHTIYVATKLGRRGDGGNGWPQNFTLKAVREHTQQSAARMGVETIFLTQWHCIPTEEYTRGEVFEHLRTIQKEGLIQHWGCSVESVEEGLCCLEHDDCASLQVIYNIFRQKLTTELLAHAGRKGVGILARVPLASGLLTGRFKADHKFGEKDHRNYNADGDAFNVGETFAGVPFDRGVAFADRIKQILKPSGGVSMAQLALRWILDDANVSAVIPGASKLSQVQSNAAASNLAPLPDDVHEQLRELYVTEIRPHIRGKY